MTKSMGVAIVTAGLLAISATLALAQTQQNNCTPEHRAAGHCK